MSPTTIHKVGCAVFTMTDDCNTGKCNCADMTTPSERERALTPNLKKLIFIKMGKDAIPDGGGFADGVKFLTTPGAMKQGWQDAVKWVDGAILAVRMATEPNPWKNSSDEEIAGEIVRKLESRKMASK